MKINQFYRDLLLRLSMLHVYSPLFRPYTDARNLFSILSIIFATSQWVSDLDLRDVPFVAHSRSCFLIAPSSCCHHSSRRSHDCRRVFIDSFHSFEHTLALTLASRVTLHIGCLDKAKWNKQQHKLHATRIPFHHPKDKCTLLPTS